jgi:hypothetical protein
MAEVIQTGDLYSCSNMKENEYHDIPLEIIVGISRSQ